MSIVPQEMMKNILLKYPEEYHELLQKQTLAMEDTIINHMNEYKYSQDYRKAIDTILADILNGKYLGVKIHEN